MEIQNKRPLFPWYKERLRTKYLKVSTNKITSVSSCCCLVNVSLDDFSVGPSVLSKVRRVSKEHACFSRQMIRKQIGREYVNAVEEKLKQHPLVLYPHYRDHMSPELFEKVVSVLDPDMCVNSASSLPTPTAERAEEEEEGNCAGPRNKDGNKAKQGATASKIDPDVPNQGPRNPYTLPMNGKGIEKGQKVKVNQLNNHKGMRAATKPFR
ncbi:uncharacterized protein zgc:158260 [Pleuronectes platessa]|uniref:uncharacterized protein zgc:158260 n=1 Tax=Pleuronectes platessa TaxID=8262 RepID=UPI00232A7A0B|nr:uncharacterized protein zgc:158260 [Pleuronectes platessa]